MARTGDKIGRKNILLVTGIFGFIGAIVMASAKSMEIVIAGSVIFGVYWAVLVCWLISRLRLRGGFLNDSLFYRETRL